MMRLLPSLGLFVLFAASTAVAAPAADTNARIQWIQSRLDAASGPARRWQYGWTTIHGATAFLYGVQVQTLDDPDQEHDRVDARVSAVSSTLGFIGMFLDPLTTASNARDLAALPAATDAEQDAKLKQAETFLRRNAEQEQGARSVQAHVLTTLVSLISGLVVARNDHRNDDGMRMFAESMLVGELQIYTAPTQATEAWEAYQRGDLNTAARSSGDSGLIVSALPHGVALNYIF